eukprot:761238-Hanusia_phi.AAC.3
MGSCSATRRLHAAHLISRSSLTTISRSLTVCSSTESTGEEQKPQHGGDQHPSWPSSRHLHLLSTSYVSLLVLSKHWSLIFALKLLFRRSLNSPLVNHLTLFPSAAVVLS